MEWRSARYIHLNDGNFLDMFQTQEVVPFVSAFAMVSLHDDPVFDVVGDRIVGATPQFQLHELSLLLCAFAKVSVVTSGTGTFDELLSGHWRRLAGTAKTCLTPSATDWPLQHLRNSLFHLLLGLLGAFVSLVPCPQR